MQSNGGEVLIGADVSKAWIDVCQSETARVDRIVNTPEALAAWVAQARPTLVAMEPTGGYERALCFALAEAGVRYVKLHPNAILAFRKARGVRAKTDRIDAMLIARYLADARGRADLPATFRADERLRALAARRRQLVDARQAEGCRADLANDPFVRESLALVIGALTQSLEAIEEAIERHIAGDGELDRLAKVLRAVRGVGPVVAATLIADLPELGRLSGKQIAALVGLAPTPTKAEKEKGKPKPVMDDRSCAAPCSTPPAPLSAIPPRCATSTLASPIPTIDPERSPSPRSCGKFSSSPTPSPETTSRPNIKTLDLLHGRWPGQARP